MKLGLATLAATGVLAAAAPTQASTPVPWCGTSSSSVDRLPDATEAYSIHVSYVRPPGTPDRFAEFAPRIAGDAAAFDAWWRREDPARAPRFDLFPAPGCASAFGSLDITSLQLPDAVAGFDEAFDEIRRLLSVESGFNTSDKVYLAYYDGPTGQTGPETVCGQGTRPSFGRPGLAVVHLDSCDAADGDALRPVVAIHELVHVLGAVSRSAPSSCQSGHVCDFDQDLMTAFLSGEELDWHVLDFGRDDYYGHAGSWPDLQDSPFLERLDSPDRAAPTVPDGLRVGDEPSGMLRFSWQASTDDRGPVAYRVYQDGRFLREVTTTSVLLPDSGSTSVFAVRAADPAGRLSAVTSARFRPGLGMVDAQGRLVRDTVRPPAIPRVTIRRTQRAAVLTWPGVRDGGGLSGYRVRIGSRTLVVRKPAITLARARVTGAVSIAALDRAGNVGPALVISRSRLR